ncbi:hypothetical protein CAI21_11090 [Alkalilimnicola ehrlichii]|uniref:HTH tetR-type domain-containing protein n=1 Tax=Alkalilimnicola ehrlichii TaxID=351052 RepID=A0A3E0X1M5_9GAMM|nr:TetR family transcriptional regulator [Alkalilimnicola ehrlichii]RFA28990.1 hypothetical protein CAI21_11090 [Alkalilimnicola ehrlichii]RFA38626.1 hypothetical protein CAL65_04640 [Alkalilimnicola ehrlichii]
MARRTKAEAEATRESILDAAIEVFLEKGVSRTTLEMIARRAGVTRGAVYWHFKDKNDLFTALAERARAPMAELADSIRESSEGNVLEMIHEVCRRVLKTFVDSKTQREIYTVLWSRCEYVSEINPSVERQKVLDAESMDQLTKDFETAKEQGLLRDSVDPRAATVALMSLMKGMSILWLRDPELYEMPRYGEEMLDYYFTGIRRH